VPELPAHTLIDLDDARSYLTLDAGDVEDDGPLGDMIIAASSAIIRWTRRQFAPAVDDSTRAFSYDGRGFLSLARNDLRAATEIAIGTESPIVLTSSDYRLQPLPSQHGVFTYIQFRRSCAPVCNELDTEISITGNWGFEIVPDDAKQACRMQVAVWQRGDRMAFTRAYNPTTGTVEGGEGLAGSVKALLGDYRAAVVG